MRWKRDLTSLPPRTKVPVLSGPGGYQVLSAVGVVCLAIALAREILLKNAFAEVLVVLSLCLIRLRRQMGSRGRSVDIRTRPELYDDWVETTYHDGLITLEGLLTKQYIIPRSTVKNMQNLLELVFEGKIRIFGTNGKQIRSREVRQERLPLRFLLEA